MKHTVTITPRHYVGVTAKGHYRAACTCGNHSRGDLTKRQATAWKCPDA